MKNSFRAISFIIPFLSIILMITFILPYIPGVENGIVFFSILAFLAIVLFPFLQALIRYLYYIKFYDKNNYFFSIELGEKKLFQRILYYIFIFLILIFPIVGKNFNFKNLSKENIITTIIFILISEIILYFTHKKTKLKFMSNGLLIIGLDLRLDIPMGNSLSSNSGFYSYNEFKYYSINKGTLTLYINENDKIKGKLPKEIEPQTIAFLNNKEIRIKR